MVFNTTRAKYANQSPLGAHALDDRSRASSGPRTPKRVQFSRCIHLPSWADAAAAFERTAQNRNIDFAIASAAGASGIHLRNARRHATFRVSERAAEGAQEMVPVLSGGRIG